MRIATIVRTGRGQGAVRTKRQRCCAARTPSVPRQIQDCYLYPCSGEVKGIVHFIGGAFGGAVPHVLYPSFLSDLAANGYSTIATPFPVTFKHKECSELLRDRFENVVCLLRDSNDSYDIVPDDVPVHGIGHSFGALAHSLIGCSRIPIASNVLVSFNNKEVESAIPIPGLLPAVRLAFQLYDQSPMKLITSPIPTVKTLLKEFVKQVNFEETISALVRRSVDDGIDQVDSILMEIQQGFTNFDPVPDASAELIKTEYNVPKTLLLQFTNDSIDESSFLYNLISSTSPSQTIVYRKINGTHLTPCVGDLRWIEEVIDFKLDDEVIDFVQKQARIENREFVDIVIDWLNKNS
eukprot:g5394.t1